MVAGTLRRIVVAGNGIAGLTACDTLRAEGFDGEITVVGAETDAAYSRPALSKALLKGEADLAAHQLPPPTHGATELRGVRAKALDPAAHRVTLSDGTRLAYDGLVIATGSRARRLTAGDREHTVRELGDALAIRTALAAASRVVVVGGGALGMEVATGALAAGCAVTLVATSTPMSKQLGGHLAGVLGAAAAAQGLDVVVAREVVVAEEGGRVTADGVDIDADVLITAVGDAPNVEWLEGSGILQNGALLADGRGRIRDDIVAAGDVATWRGADGPWRIPLWTTAIEQAKTAAAALVRGAEVDELDFQPYFWTEQFGVAVKAVGRLPVHGDPEVLDRGDGSSALLRWARPDGGQTAVAVDYRIPVPKLRRLTHAPVTVV